MLSRTLAVAFQQTARFSYDLSGEERELIVGRLYRDSAFIDKIALRDTLPASALSPISESGRSYLGQNIQLIRG